MKEKVGKPEPVISPEPQGGLTRRARPLLGTLVEIALPTNKPAAFEAGFAAIARVHQLMSFHEEGSDLGILRRARPGHVTTIAPETAQVMTCALELHRLSGGLFDMTVGRKLVRCGFLPHEGLVHLNRFPGRMSDISFVGPCLVRQERVALIDLGGIAKGYAVDHAVQALLNHGMPSGLVNAGGDLRIFGDLCQTVFLRRGDGQILELGDVHDLAIASSENRLNRRKRHGETRTPHVGPSGRAVMIDGLVSVAADSCMIADAMTKIAMTDHALADRLLEPHGGRVLYCDRD